MCFMERAAGGGACLTVADVELALCLWRWETQQGAGPTHRVTPAPPPLAGSGFQRTRLCPHLVISGYFKCLLVCSSLAVIGLSCGYGNPSLE